jgi:CheY-like chemotaxis protein
MVRALDAAGLTVVPLADLQAAAVLAEDDVEPPDALLLSTSAQDLGTVERSRIAQRYGVATAKIALVEAGFRGEASAWRRAGFDAYLPYPVAVDDVVEALGVLWAAPDGRPPFLTAHRLRDRAPRKLNVLVVDDNPLNARLATVLLERHGHAVMVAGDGAEALAIVAAGEVDAVLMDVQMPGMDGLEATRRIRALETPAAATPIIAVTANAALPDLEACRDAGMDDVVTKPIEPSGLLAALSYAAERRTGEAG